MLKFFILLLDDLLSVVEADDEVIVLLEVPTGSLEFVSELWLIRILQEADNEVIKFIFRSDVSIYLGDIVL